MIIHKQDPQLVEPITLEERKAFLKLPLEERRRRLAEQAQQLMEHYSDKTATAERMEWQAGDIVE